jgi:hypothetical protein
MSGFYGRLYKSAGSEASRRQTRATTEVNAAPPGATKEWGIGD